MAGAVADPPLADVVVGSFSHFPGLDSKDSGGRILSQRRFLRNVFGTLISEPSKGAGKLVPRESCRNVSKIIFDTFWRFLTLLVLRENCRNLS